MKNYRYLLCSGIFLLTWFDLSYPDVTYKPIPIIANPWQVESLFVGIGFLTKDENLPVSVTWKYRKSNSCLGQLFLQARDTQLPLFHNFIEQFPVETTQVNLGFFPKGTSIYIGYSMDSLNTFCIGGIYFSGQNREDYEPFLSINRLTFWYGNRWLAGNRLTSTVVEAGFDDRNDMAFQSLIFRISNVYVEGIEKFKLPLPVITNNSENNNQIVTIEKKSAVNKLIRGKDTTFVLLGTDKIQVYYTIDGSDPTASLSRVLYTNPFPVAASLTVKAVLVTNDTNWFHSEVTAKAIVVDIAGISDKKNNVLYVPDIISEVKIFNLKGRIVTPPQSFRVNNQLSGMPQGVYFIKYLRQGKPIVQRVVVSK
jgi:hypothetical protein